MAGIELFCKATSEKQYWSCTRTTTKDQSRVESFGHRLMHAENGICDECNVSTRGIVQARLTNASETGESQVTG